MGSATYVYDHAVELLAAALAGIDPARTGHDLPGRTYVGWSDPPADMNCSGAGTLVVSHRVNSATNVRNQPNAQGLAGRRPRGRSLQVIRYRVTLFRCWPIQQRGTAAPDAATIDVAAKGLMVDEWCLTKHLLQAARDATLFTNTRPDQVAVRDAVLMPAKGGAAGVRLDVELDANDSGPP